MIAKPVPNRGLYAAETEIEALVPEQRPGKFHEIGISGLCQPVEHGSARKTEAKHFRDLVVGLSGGIVERLAQEFMFKDVSHQHKLRVSAGNRQTEKGEIGLWFIDEIRIEVCLHVINAYEGHAEAVGHCFREIQSHQERSHESGSVGRA